MRLKLEVPVLAYSSVSNHMKYCVVAFVRDAFQLTVKHVALAYDHFVHSFSPQLVNVDEAEKEKERRIKFNSKFAIIELFRSNATLHF